MSEENLLIQLGHLPNNKPLYWIKVGCDENEVILITSGIIFMKALNYLDESYDCNSSDLIRYLNEEFFRQCFSADEQKLIQQSSSKRIERIGLLPYDLAKQIESEDLACPEMWWVQPKSMGDYLTRCPVMNKEGKVEFTVPIDNTCGVRPCIKMTNEDYLYLLQEQSKAPKGYTYVMSDLHGEYEMYKQMLAKIDFKDKDRLIILGDCCDRGKYGILILLDLMNRENVTCVKGNHDVMLLDNIHLLLGCIPDNPDDCLLYPMTDQEYENMELWLLNGGGTTIKGLSCLDESERIELYDFVASFKDYLELTVNGNNYVMIHAGFYKFEPEKELSEYAINDLIWDELDYSRTYFDDKYLVTGHTITKYIPSNPNKGKIYMGNRNIAIDCGAFTDSGRLACLRLDDLKEFYIEKT